MRRAPLLTTFAASLLLCTLPIAAQERGYWPATSNTARSITGDISLTDQKLVINFVGFTIAHIRALEKSEIAALFDADTNDRVASVAVASLYRINIPASRKFLHKNSLCGGEDTQWMVTYLAGRTLRVAFFSGQKAPVLTLEAIPTSTDLCGTFTYAR